MSVDGAAVLAAVLSFVSVVAASLVGSLVVVVLFATGIRLLATPPLGTAAAGSARDEEMDDVPGVRPRGATARAAVCFVLAGAIALFGVALIVPALHALVFGAG